MQDSEDSQFEQQQEYLYNETQNVRTFCKFSA